MKKQTAKIIPFVPKPKPEAKKSREYAAQCTIISNTDFVETPCSYIATLRLKPKTTEQFKDFLGYV